MKKGLHPYQAKSLWLFIILFFLGSYSVSHAQQTTKRVMLQAFWWDYWNSNYPGSWSNYLVELAPRLKSMGIDAVWIPPSTKGNGGVNDVGYAPFDHYDLGDKQQKSSVNTRMGTKDELLRLIAVLHANGIEVVQDVVPNHLIGAGDLTSGGEDPAAPDDKYKLFRYTCYATPAQLQTAAEYRLREGRFPKNWQNFHPNTAHNCNSGDICQQLFGPDICFWDGATGQTTVPNTYDPNQATYSPYNNGGTGSGNGYMRKNYREWLIWYKKQTGFDGVRMDAVKHFEEWVAEDFLYNLQFGSGFANGGNAMFNVGEFVGGAGQLDNWTNAVQKRAGTFDFSLRDGLKQMIDNGLFNVANLPGFQQTQRVNFVGADNTFYHITVPFVNNHDTFRPCLNANGNYIGWQDGSNCAPSCLDNGVCRDNELADHVDPFNPRMALGYAAMFAVDGQPQIFYEDLFDIGGSGNRYTHRPDIAATLPVRPYITNLIWCHQNLDFKSGAYKVRSTAAGGNVFFESGSSANDLLIIERSGRAVIGINDRGDGVWQSAFVDSDFAPGTQLKDYSGANGSATITVPGDRRIRINTPPVDAANNRWGYSVWAPVGQDADVYIPARNVRTTQEWEMADDLGDSHCSSLGQGGHLPAGSTNFRIAGKIFVQSGTAVNYTISREAAFSSQPVVVQFADLNGVVHHRQQATGTLTGSFNPNFSGWLTIKVRNAVAANSKQKVWVNVSYQAPPVVDVDAYNNQPQTKVSIFTGNGGDNDWTNCRNWEEGKVPDTSAYVVIPEGQTLDLSQATTTLNVQGMEIQSGGNLILPTGKTLIVQNRLTNGTGSPLSICGTVLLRNSISFPITINGVFNLCNLTLNSSSKLVLNSSISVSGILSLQRGCIETGSNEIHVTNPASGAVTGYLTNNTFIDGNLRRNVSGTQTYEFPVGDGVRGLNLATVQFTSAPSATNLLARFSFGTTQSSVPRTLTADVNNDGMDDQVFYNCVYGGWVITADNNTANNYSLTLSPSTVLQSTCTGGQYPTIGKDGVYTANSGFTKSFTGFSTFDVVTANNVVLPVRFLQVNGTVVNDKANLVWKVAEDGEQLTYVVEKSKDGQRYANAGTVQALSGAGERTYRWTDETFNGNTYYRVMARQSSGAVQYSSAVLLRSATKGLQLSISPNPFHQQISLNVSGVPANEPVAVLITDRQGRQLLKNPSCAVKEVESIVNKVLQQQAAGTYLIRVQWKEEVQVKTVVKQ